MYMYVCEHACTGGSCTCRWGTCMYVKTLSGRKVKPQEATYHQLIIIKML